jgi:hypothetical protein
MKRRSFFAALLAPFVAPLLPQPALGSTDAIKLQMDAAALNPWALQREWYRSSVVIPWRVADVDPVAKVIMLERQ